MKLIVITQPNFFEGEAAAIQELLSAGLEILHLRKPESTRQEVQDLLQQIDEVYHPRIVLHEHFDLTEVFHLKGIHLNRRNPLPPAHYQGHISCSCHSLQEVNDRKSAHHYVFLSPIYHSISKVGYSSAFTPEELRQAAHQGIIDAQVMALGGINASHLAEVKSIGFGGAVLLGDVWNHLGLDLVNYFKQLKQAAL